MLMLFTLVAIATHFTQQEPAGALALACFKWMGFTLLGYPTINGYGLTSTIMAGVVWSLRYEWVFYAALPLIAFIARLGRFQSLLVSLAIVLLIANFQPTKLYYTLGFVGGMLAAYLFRFPKFLAFCRLPGMSLVSTALVVCSIVSYDSPFLPLPVTLLFTAFVLIAGGCSLFGILEWRVSKKFGDLSYGNYLLHGFFLYVTFTFILNPVRASVLSPRDHWLVVLAIAPVLVCACHFAFRWIEQPSIAYTNRLSRRLHAAIPGNRLFQQGDVSAPKLIKQIPD